MDGVTGGGIYSGDPGVVSLHRIWYLISSHTILSCNELHTPSFASFDLTHSFRDFVWIHAIAWVLAAGLYNILSPSSYAPRARTALSHEFLFGCRERWGGVSTMGSLSSSFAVSPQRHVHQGFDVFRHIPCTVCDLPKPDLLHTMQIGKLDHHQKWIIHFMKTHERLDKYNAIWLSVPAYHNLTPKNKSYEEDSQWNGTERKEMSRYLLGVVTQSLRGGSPAQHPIFNRAIECLRAFLEFYVYAR